MSDVEQMCILIFEKTLDEVAEEILKGGINRGSESVRSA